MLAWTQRSDGWHANGFLIRLVEPFCWVLLEDRVEPEATVHDAVEPLATARTLTECKREAELLVTARHRSSMRKRLIARILLALCALPLSGGLAAPWDLLVATLLGGVALGSAVTLAATFFTEAKWSYDELFYQ